MRINLSHPGGSLRVKFVSGCDDTYTGGAIGPALERSARYGTVAMPCKDLPSSR